MARDGSGNYTRVEGPYVNGTVADADEVNNELDDVADSLSDSVNIAGTKAMAADWSMGGFRLKDLAAPSSNNDAARKAYVDSAITAASQPLDATLTAFSGLTTAASQYIRSTGTDAFTMDSYATVLSNLGALNTTSGDARYAQLAGASGNTFSYDATTIFNRASTPYLIQRNLGGAARGYDGADATYCYIVYDSGGTWRLRINNSTGLVEVNGAAVAALAVSSETGTPTSASINKQVNLASAPTINTSVGSASGADKIIFDPGTSSRVFTRGSGMTMYLNGVDVASATLAANRMGGIHYRSSTVCLLVGAFS